jgi:hypothetical protein
LFSAASELLSMPQWLCQVERLPAFCISRNTICHVPPHRRHFGGRSPNQALETDGGIAVLFVALWSCS